MSPAVIVPSAIVPAAIVPVAVREDRRTWGAAGVIALAGHVALALAVLGPSRPVPAPQPEPVVLVELPAEAGPAAAEPAQRPVSPSAAAAQPQATLPALPAVAPPAAPPLLPTDPVILPGSAPPAPARQAAPAPVLPAASLNQAALSPTGAGSGTSPLPGTDPRARAAEVDYFSLLSAYLNRRKTYPVEARKARAEGVVVVRFTVGRDGSVSATAIKRSSGHDLLDQATLALLQRVAPLPRMPAAMQRQTVTLALPIEYSLKTS